MAEHDRPPGVALDYAGPPRDAPRPVRPLAGARLIACAVLVLAGCVLMGSALIAGAHFAAAKMYTDDDDLVQGAGVVIGLIGLAGFLAEYLRGWRQRER
jgi:hypothetical protein